MKIKKDKTSKAEAPPADETPVKPENGVKTIDTAIFDHFKNLTNDEEKIRLNASFKLVELICRTHDKEKKAKVLQYTLKRVIRGVGASTSASRAGFFTTLVALLTSIPKEEVSIATVLEVTEKQLHVGAVTNKEDADGIVGQILVVGSILRSNKFQEATTEELKQITKLLIDASRHRAYHATLAFTFITDIIEKVSEESFTSAVWPEVEVEINKPWSKQTINTVYCLTVAQKKFPEVINTKYMKAHFGGPEILNGESFKPIMRIFWENNNPNTIMHPAFDSFGAHIANNKHLVEFWTKGVDVCLHSSTKLREIQSLKILTDVLANTQSTKVAELLSPNFIKMIVASLKTIKTKKDETLIAFYDEFFESLNTCVSKITSEEQKVEIIKRLVIHPGVMNLEKYTTTRVIHQLFTHLGEKGVQSVFELYKDIFLGKVPKNPEDNTQTWLNIERQNAGFILQHLMGHKQVQSSFEWRTTQLKFFMNFGLFYTNDKSDIVTKEQAGEISNEYSTQMKNIFYTSLQSKLPRLVDEKNVLISLVDVLNANLKKKNFQKFFRTKIDEKILKVWNEMYAEVKKTDKKQTQLQLVFHMLLLHMGVHLFREPEMAEAAILDLEKCMERTKSKRGSKTSEEEPAWIEVVTDLFLHLLSQNASALRNVVNSVFPHLCENLSLTAIHQILSVLDMKDGNNPLDVAGEEEDEDENEGEEEEEKEESDDEEENDEDDDEEDDDDDEEIEEEEEEEGTTTDKLRNAVSIALGKAIIEDDQESIDLNDMTEEEGQQLDEALAAAFAATKKPEGKRSKTHRVKTTTTMHFRIRVLDLIEIYIQHNPKMLIAIEIMHALFNMIEFCMEDDLKPLLQKVEKVLSKLTALKQFGVESEDITETNIVDFLRLVIEKKVRSAAFDVHNKIRSKCTVFLITCSKQLKTEKGKSGIVTLLNGYVDEFIKSRNPILNISVLIEIFKMRWIGVWKLASNIVSNGLCGQIRTFRRIQILELIALLYKHHHNEDGSKKSLKPIEAGIQKLLRFIATKTGQEISTKEFNTLLDVLFIAHKSKSNELASEDVCNLVQEIRKKIKLDSANVYQRFCALHKLNVIKNSEVVTANGHTNGQNPSEEEEEVEAKSAKNKKRKSGPTETNLRKEKKLKKESRMKTSSEGLNGGFDSFESVPIDVDMSDGSANEDEE